MPLLFVSCESKSDIKEPQVDREKFVGVYQLSVECFYDYPDTDDSIKNNADSFGFYDYGCSFELRLKDSLSNKLTVLNFSNNHENPCIIDDPMIPIKRVYPYFGNLSAEIKDGYLYFDALYQEDCIIGDCCDTTIYTKEIIFDEAELIGDNLYWSGVCTETIFSSSTNKKTCFVGVAHYAATKQ